ncbi:conserved exported hypothetical protein [Luteimonas sp. 9C]|uniref:DUF4124 domain-containing protein n=1 Tax=Luteimonas sp. 9C TaxID=2653148 RepID=UPI0012EF64F5|nr:DUF4124 domain-containing protein [Luteimonas sp. 9C]VXA96044.1 conserved exported hypothetical protein [Luteimonas sp. 9C]
MRRTSVTALAWLIAGALLAALLAAPLAASEVYSWKDARGVTHYSQTPPPAGTRFEVRNMQGANTSSTPTTPAPVAQPAAAATTAGAAGDAGQCELARTNVAALKGDGAVQQLGADGKPRELAGAERADQLALSEAAVRAYCR